jgi:hypothetical protein
VERRTRIRRVAPRSAPSVLAFLLLVAGCAAPSDRQDRGDTREAHPGATGGGSIVGAGGSTSAVGGSTPEDGSGGSDDAGVVTEPDGAPGDGGSTGADGSTGTGGGDVGTGGSGGFRHPGVIVNRGQLEFIKNQIKAGADPWSSAVNRTSRSGAGSLSHVPAPRAIVECGSYSMPDIGCGAEREDAVAAYTNALLWYFTSDAKHAQKAVEIMNAWSAVLQDHTNSNAPLQAAWAGTMFARAGEIIRHTSDAWAAADVDRYAGMLKNVFLPKVGVGSTSNGNWELTMIDAAIGIGVFLDDREVFDRAVSMWRARVPAYIYLTSDGATPKQPPGSKKSAAQLTEFWYGQTMLVDGLGQETCRDLGHFQLGLAGMINAAETARIQGVHLYQEESKRIAAGLEFHAQFLNGAAVPTWLCGGTLNGVSDIGTWEIAYNEYANRESLALPNTKQVVLKNRPTGGSSQHYAWESLTHAEVGSVGIE